MLASEITKRYQLLVKRSFERHTDLFLTSRFVQHPNRSELDTTIAEFKDFAPTMEEWKRYLQSHQAKNWNVIITGKHTVRELDQAIKGWWSHNKEGLAAYRQAHQESIHCLSFADLQAIITDAGPVLACTYCRISEDELQRLIAAGQVQTKRLRTRGTTFEFDCRLPERGYAAGNVCLCCYWCNNAKTDEFDAEEFQPMADAIAQVWRQRLARIEPAEFKPLI